MSIIPMMMKAALMVMLLGGVGVLMTSLLLRWAESRFGLSHPSWTHAPAVSVFLVTVAFAALMKAVGSDGPVAYVNSVNQYPTMGHFASYFAPVGILIIGLSVLLDELWARQETRKTFNWMSLLDEAVIGFMLMLAYGKAHHFYLVGDTLRHTVTANNEVMILVAVMIAAAAILEVFRRPAPRENYVVAEDTSALEAELARRAGSGERIAYFEGQNPAYLTVLVVVMSAALVFGALMSWRAAMPWVSLLLVVFASAFTLLYGGIRVLVTSALLEVRLGMLGMRLLTLPTAEISQVSVYGSAAVQEVGGRAGRGSRELTVFCLGNRRGVEVATAPGKRYLIGSDRPDRLAAVIAAARGAGTLGAA